MMRQMLAAVLTLLVALAATTVVAANRHALVIGIDDYAHVDPLLKARNDARAVHAALAAAGFRAELLLDADLMTMAERLEVFGEQIDPGDEVVFFFAGHGVEIDGRNYLLPADVPMPARGGDLIVRRSSLPLADVTGLMQRRGARISLVILDACRDNPFARAGTRAIGASRGLARVTATEGTYILFSAGEGQAALDRLSDNDPDPNSVFTRALLPRLTEPGLPLRTMVQQVRSDVRRLARTVGHDQFPAVYDQLDGDFSFLPAAMSEAPQLAANRDACTAAQSVWAALRNSTDETALTAFADGYAAACPALAAQARARLENLASAPDPEIARRCERLAGDAFITSEDLRNSDTAAAIDACRVAVEAFPKDAMLLYNLGRAHDAAEHYPAAARFYREAAEGGNTEAMLRLATFFRWGLGVSEDIDQALTWYRRAAEAGSTPAMLDLGSYFQWGKDEPNDIEALRWYRRAAEAGDEDGMYSVGLMYREGIGVAQNDTEALRWFRRSADAGYSYAFFAVGRAYRDGAGVQPDENEAFRWFLRGAEAGDGFAMYEMGAIFDGGRGVPADTDEATRWYERAAYAGHSRAMGSLGSRYHYGWPVEQDYDKAAFWYREGTERGNLTAIVGLGLLHRDGHGVAQDHVEAARLFRRAAERGHTSAMTYLGYAYLWGQGVGADAGAARSWFLRAAEWGDREAKWALGGLYHDGQGVARDDVEAARWFMESLRGGVFTWFALNDAPNWRRGTLREVQRILQQEGVYSGTLDGIFGPQTRAALEAYAMLD